MLLGWLAQGMQVRDWAALTCLFVVKPNACQRRPQSQARIPSAAGVEPKGGVPALESLQRPAWRAAGPARGLAAADAGCAGLPMRDRARGPQRRGAPGSCSGGAGRSRRSESSRCCRLRHGAWDLVALSGSTLGCRRVAVGADRRTRQCCCRRGLCSVRRKSREGKWNGTPLRDLALWVRHSQSSRVERFLTFHAPLG